MVTWHSQTSLLIPFNYSTVLCKAFKVIWAFGLFVLSPPSYNRPSYTDKQEGVMYTPKLSWTRKEKKNIPKYIKSEPPQVSTFVFSRPPEKGEKFSRP